MMRYRLLKIGSLKFYRFEVGKLSQSEMAPVPGNAFVLSLLRSSTRCVTLFDKLVESPPIVGCVITLCVSTENKQCIKNNLLFNLFLPLRIALAIATSRIENGKKLSRLGLSLSNILFLVPTPQPPVRHNDIGIT